MTFTNFSQKQLKVLAWWTDQSPVKHRDAIICDGAVRAGKTLCLSLSFVLWAMSRFSDKNFAICGKTVSSCRRNVISPLLPILKESCGYAVDYKISQGVIEVTCGKRKNRFYIFGGKDESSSALIVGVTLAGIFFDEVAIMPQSFVQQGMARCSVEGSKFWFSCNPESPHHWFYTDWIRKQKSKNAYYIHFSMYDNPTLSPAMLKRYESLYSGVFYQRYVLGKWVVAEGVVYPMFNREFHVVKTEPRPYSRYVISNDYGTVHPCVFILFGLCNGVWYAIKEYYHKPDGQRQGQKDDVEHYDDLIKFAGDTRIDQYYVDTAPVASGFSILFRRKNPWSWQNADNTVLEGIQHTATALSSGILKFNDCCKNTIREFSVYIWDMDATTDEPVKENDDCLDALRYFVQTERIAEIKGKKLFTHGIM